MNSLELLSKNEINGEELQYLLTERSKSKADFLLIDVREEYEYNEKKIVGVDHLVPLSDFFNKVKKIEAYKSKHIIVKCKLGGRSRHTKHRQGAIPPEVKNATFILLNLVLQISKNLNYMIRK